jgi:rhodanese-related sulfurtransferase
MDSNNEEVMATVNSGTCMVAEIGEAIMHEATYTDIPVEEANYMIESDPEVIILDVSTRDEYDSEHIIGARWIQISNASAISELDGYRDWGIIVYSSDGTGSREACRVLIEHGFENVYNMVGGINAWRIGLPVSSAPKPTPTKIPASTPPATMTTPPTPTMSSSDSKRLPGFEVSFTIAGLLAVLILRRKNVRR